MNTIRLEDENYPAMLKTIKDPPKLLYYEGDIELANTYPCIAMVGARRCTSYGKYVAGKMAGRFAENGIAVVSGMAAGIDSYSHIGALEAGGKTIAVLGNSLDICFPRGSEKLQARIAKEGLILSEYPPGTHGTQFTFPERNRIISGLSVATVVVEAGLGSGSLITAERAMDQGRTVYAVPANITTIVGMGCNRLIQDGAIPIAVIDDVISDMASNGICTKVAGPSKVMKELGKDEKVIYDYILNYGETSIESLANAMNKGPKDILPIISVLEMKGVLSTYMGKIFIAK